MSMSLICKNRPKEMKKWQDCQWLRVPCGEDECPICGPIKKSRERHIARGDNPDSAENVMADVSRNFKEVKVSGLVS